MQSFTFSFCNAIKYLAHYFHISTKEVTPMLKSSMIMIQNGTRIILSQNEPLRLQKVGELIEPTDLNQEFDPPQTLCEAQDIARVIARRHGLDYTPISSNTVGEFTFEFIPPFRCGTRIFFPSTTGKNFVMVLMPEERIWILISLADWGISFEYSADQASQKDVMSQLAEHLHLSFRHENSIFAITPGL